MTFYNTLVNNKTIYYCLKLKPAVRTPKNLVRLPYHLRTLNTQSFRVTLALSVLPRLLARTLVRTALVLYVIFFHTITPSGDFTWLGHSFEHCPIFLTAGHVRDKGFSPFVRLKALTRRRDHRLKEGLLSF